MKLQDSFVIEAPVWAFLLDVPRVSACLPGAEAVKEVKPDVYEAGTQLDYEMEAAIRGRLGSIGSTVVQQTAKKMSVEFIDCVAGALAGLRLK
jgi:carbon monoxide dehydrogenase subunit G